MKTLFVLLALFIGVKIHGQSETVEIRFNKNVEFLGYIIELGDPSNNDPNHPISKIIQQFPENKNNPLLGELFELAGGLDYSTLMNLMYKTPEFPLASGYKVPAELNLALGFEKYSQTLQQIIEKTNAFYTASNFEKIWNDLAPHQQEVLNFISKNKPSEKLFKAVENYHGYSFDTYEIVPSLTLWNAGWGIKTKSKNKASFIFGPLETNYNFDKNDEFTNLTIHEFGHSFVNHVVLQNREAIKLTESLFTELKSDMVPQGYSGWETCMIEHFVRAGEVIVQEILENEMQRDALLQDYVENRSFKYLPFIVERLKKYRMEDKNTYEIAVQKTFRDLTNSF